MFIIKKALILLFCIIVSHQQSNFWANIKEQEVMGWVKEVFTTLPSHYQSVKATELGFLPGISSFLSYGVNHFKVILPDQLDISGSLNYDTLSLDVKFASLKIQSELSVMLTLEIEIKNVVISLEVNSFEHRLHAKNVEVQNGNIEFNNWLIQKVLPDSVLNNDQIKGWVKESGGYLRSLINQGFKMNQELIKFWMRDGKIFKEIDQDFVVQNIGNIQHFEVVDKEIVISLKSILHNQHDPTQEKRRAEIDAQYEKEATTADKKRQKVINQVKRMKERANFEEKKKEEHRKKEEQRRQKQQQQQQTDL